jgi:hypothetical protein
MGTLFKESPAKGSSEISTESPKIKYGKRGRPSKADKEAALAALSKAVKVTEEKKEKVKSGPKGAVVEKEEPKEEPKQKRKYTKKTDSTKEVPIKEVSRASAIVLEKTGQGTVEELKIGESKIRTITVTDTDYNRLKKIETVVRELIHSADKQGMYVGFGKNAKLPNTHEAQEGKGVKALRELLGVAKPGKGEPGDDVPF